LRRTLIAVGLALVFAAPAAAQPNVILIVTDDQRWDTLAYMPTVSSELVGKGVTYTNAFAVNPLCCPSRATILTGTYSHTNGVWTNAGTHGGFGVFRDGETLPVWLRSLGYRTGLVGKYLNGYAHPTYVPPGWDQWFANFGNPQLYFDYDITDGVSLFQFGSEPEDYATDVLAAQAVRFIRETAAPFFLYFAPKGPHITNVDESRFSVDPAPRHVDRFAGLGAHWAPNVNELDLRDKPGWLRGRAPVPAAGLAEMREEQLEALLAVDDAVAAMLAALRQTGELADTLIIYTSDNGQAWGAHRWTQKTVPYEESLRVPLVVRYDALAPAVREEARLTLNVDVAPTVLEAAGLAVAGREGRSLLPLMSGTAQWRRSFLFEHYGGPGDGVPSYCGFRSTRWKYVQYWTGEEELYDLERDPYELSNLRERWALPRRMSYRARLLSSPCRPPGFRPLPLCDRFGTLGPDRIWGWPKRDWICAGAGPDRIDVRGGRADVVRCGPGFDRVRAGSLDRLISCERRDY
jgi:N-acetylglucosamine-6-sulfatase